MSMAPAAVPPVDPAVRCRAIAMRGRGTRLATLTFPATAEGTRHALCDLCVALTGAGLAADLLSRVEMVVAEVLNNIAEHAYRAVQVAPVRLAAELCGGALCVRVRDCGRPMPGGALPDGTLPSHDVSRDLLPEGGFGWFLIRAQSDFLFYRREGRENTLELYFWPRSGG